MNDPQLAQKLANVLGTTVPTGIVHLIVRELQKAHAAGAAAEREACARIAETSTDRHQAAATIRARGKP
jgi:hypothetical protein